MIFGVGIIVCGFNSAKERMVGNCYFLRGSTFSRPASAKANHPRTLTNAPHTGLH
jgi:hypothetical protein